MASYRANFQCPATGLPVEAVYAFGRLRVEVDDEWLREDYGPETGVTSEEDFTDALAHTHKWAGLVEGRYAQRFLASLALERHGVDPSESYLEG